VRQRRPQTKQITLAQHRLTLRHILISRDTLDGIDAGSLSRSFGLSLPEVDALISEEAFRRSVRA